MTWLRAGSRGPFNLGRVLVGDESEQMTERRRTSGLASGSAIRSYAIISGPVTCQFQLRGWATTTAWSGQRIGGLTSAPRTTSIFRIQGGRRRRCPARPAFTRHRQGSPVARFYRGYQGGCGEGALSEASGRSDRRGSRSPRPAPAVHASDGHADAKRSQRGNAGRVLSERGLPNVPGEVDDRKRNGTKGPGHRTVPSSFRFFI